MRNLACAILLVTATAAAAPRAALPFIADDYARARAAATERHLPLFVEVWAPW